MPRKAIFKTRRPGSSEKGAEAERSNQREERWLEALQLGESGEEGSSSFPFVGSRQPSGHDETGDRR